MMGSYSYRIQTA